MPGTQPISKLTSKSQTVVPRAVRHQLGLKPGDHIRYRMQGKHAVIERVENMATVDDPFIAFDEWASEQDDKAFRKL